VLVVRGDLRLGERHESQTRIADLGVDEVGDRFEDGLVDPGVALLGHGGS
jgi:hypothetical protein